MNNVKLELKEYLQQLDSKLGNQELISLLNTVMKEEYGFQLISVDDMLDLFDKRSDKVDTIIELIEELRGIDL